MKKALIYASVASMIQQFNMNNIRLLLELGYKVDVMCNLEQGSTISQQKIEEMLIELKQMGVDVQHVAIPRKIIKLADIFGSIIKTKKVINDNQYDLIHCHSPIGGIICRFANRLSKQYGKAKMIYTAHGFHFYKGASIKNWIFFYGVEKICSRFTDVLITINKEDYVLAQNKMKALKIEYVPGIGVDISKSEDVVVDRRRMREKLGIPQEAKLLISVGEINSNKNHETVIRALGYLRSSEYYYIIVGQGEKSDYIETLIKELQMENRVFLLGYRSDVIELYKISDICVFPSYREGLSVALMEAMSCGLPCVVSRIRGNVDLVDENGGVLFDPNSFYSCAKCISEISNLQEKGKYNKRKIKKFDKENVMSKMRDIYL